MFVISARRVLGRVGLCPFVAPAVVIGGMLTMIVAGQNRAPTPPAMPRALIQQVVSGRPFEAHFVSSHPGTQNGETGQVSGSVYRDNHGRTGVKYHFPTGEETTIVSDVIAGRVLVISDQSHTAETMLLPTNSFSGWAFTNSVPMRTGEYRDMVGVRCRLVVLLDSTTRASIGEIWLSDEMAIVMRDEGSVGGLIYEWRVTDIRLSEPDPARFQIPSGYKAVDVDDARP